MAWKLEEILAATGGAVEREGTRKMFGEVVTDSARVKKGAVFVALKGERLDGHAFAGAAVRRGATCVVAHRDLPRIAVRRATVVRVPDTLRALGDLAHFRREKFAPKVLAITGSNGKTTTKEMVAAIFEEAVIKGQAMRGKVLKTQGNFNNLIGLPLTLLRLSQKDQIAVVELGTNRPGEIARLAEIADADCAIVTSVAAAHLEGLNSLAGVAHEKGALYRKLRAEGTIAVNLDDPIVRRLGGKSKHRKITYGSRGQVRARAARRHNAGGMEFILQAKRQRRKVRLNYLGRHNVTNALGAAALALAAGAKLPAICRGLEKSRPFAMRMEASSWRGIAIINDAYNANPASMKAALRTLAEAGGRGESVAVLGDMFELGKRSRQEHGALGKEIAKAGIDRVYLLGAQASLVRKGALGAGMKAERVVIGESHADIAQQLGRRLKSGDCVLFKGSRGMAMEKILDQLQRRGLGA